MFEPSKVAQIALEMEQHNISILGISEAGVLELAGLFSIGGKPSYIQAVEITNTRKEWYSFWITWQAGHF